MRPVTLGILAALMTTGVTTMTDARRIESPPPQIRAASEGSKRFLPVEVRPSLAAALADTFVLASFGFDNGAAADPQGWHSADRTAQVDTFWHAADSMELVGNSFSGDGTILEGERSMYVGTRGNTFETCAFVETPGYGNSWTQYLQSRKFSRSGDVTFSFKVEYDSEPGYDKLYVQFVNGDGYWESAPVGLYGFYDGSGLETESVVLPDTSLGDSVQVRFLFRSDGAFSAQDGLWPALGVVVDSIMLVDDGGLIDYEDFEGTAVGDYRSTDGDWYATLPESFGDFADLFPGTTVLQEDLCLRNLSSGVWGFFKNSPDTYACGGHPEQEAIPFKRSVPNPYGGPYITTLYMNNEIWSPVLDWDEDVHGQPIPATASNTWLEFDAYGAQPIDNLVFYFWRVRSVFSGCPARWRNDQSLQYDLDDSPEWLHHVFNISSFIDAGADAIQVAIGVLDGCIYWCNIYGTGACHSHGPLIDNARVIRTDEKGPNWSVRNIDLFQDDFSADGTTTGTVRMDVATDGCTWCTDPVPLDTAVVTVRELNVGLDYHQSGVPSSGPAVYVFVKDVSVAKSGAAISDNPAKYPAVSIPQGQPGWTVLRFDSVPPDPWGGVDPHVFQVDLNDNLFEPGDTIEYYYGARDALGRMNFWTQEGGINTQAAALATRMEVTCLPANAKNGATDILYVDDADGHGVQPYFDSAFEALGLRPDRYDVLAPTAAVGNGPGRRVRDVMVQLASHYRKIIWSTGELREALIGDGPDGENPEASDDFAMLFEFLDQGTNNPGVYITGDYVASEWDASSSFGAALALRNTYMNFTLTGGDHTALGEPLSPLVIGRPGSCFDGDTLIAHGGCPVIDHFDVLQKTGASLVDMGYSGNSARAAVLTQTTINTAGDTARVVLSGFSFDHISDDKIQFPPDRIQHLLGVLRWLDNDVDDPTAVPIPSAYSNVLLQNYPNPFNPVTTIRYSIGKTGHVSLVVYDVTGARVRTLVNGIQSPRPGGYFVRWDGRNDNGAAVASGVYYYRIVTKAFTSTKKMLLLK